MFQGKCYKTRENSTRLRHDGWNIYVAQSLDVSPSMYSTQKTHPPVANDSSNLAHAFFAPHSIAHVSDQDILYY